MNLVQLLREEANKMVDPTVAPAVQSALASAVLLMRQAADELSARTIVYDAQKIIPPGMTFEQALRSGMAGRIEFRPYLDWIKTLPCHTCGAHPPCDPSHLNTLKGAGTKSADLLAIPECRPCHDNYERLVVVEQEMHNARIRAAAFYLMQAFYEGRLIWRK